MYRQLDVLIHAIETVEKKSLGEVIEEFENPLNFSTESSEISFNNYDDPRHSSKSGLDDSFSISDQDLFGTADQPGMHREVHNKLEKNRRAQMKENYALVKQALGIAKKISNYNLLQKSISKVNDLAMKGELLEKERNALRRENEKLKKRKSHLSGQTEDDMTSTASECEDEVGFFKDYYSSNHNSPSVSAFPTPSISTNSSPNVNRMLSDNSSPVSPISPSITPSPITQTLIESSPNLKAIKLQQNNYQNVIQFAPQAVSAPRPGLITIPPMSGPIRSSPQHAPVISPNVIPANFKVANLSLANGKRCTLKVVPQTQIPPTVTVMRSLYITNPVYKPATKPPTPKSSVLVNGSALNMGGRPVAQSQFPVMMGQLVNPSLLPHSYLPPQPSLKSMVVVNPAIPSPLNKGATLN